MNKVAFITGGSRGIGSAAVKALAKDGYCVIFTYNKNKEKAEKLVGCLKSNNLYSEAVRCDVSDRQSVKAAVEITMSRYGDITLLVNNAGIAWEGLFTDMSDKDWTDIFNVNVNGIYNCCQEIIPSMIRNHSGNIINISSMWGQTGASCEVAYSTTKAAVIGFTKSLAKELGPSGIRVNCIAPGVIKTDMLNCYNENDLAALCDETPLERLGTPEDIAKAVRFLASDDSSFITGQILSVNGGFII